MLFLRVGEVAGGNVGGDWEMASIGLGFGGSEVGETAGQDHRYRSADKTDQIGLLKIGIRWIWYTVWDPGSGGRPPETPRTRVCYCKVDSCCISVRGAVPIAVSDFSHPSRWNLAYPNKRRRGRFSSLIF